MCIEMRFDSLQKKVWNLTERAKEIEAACATESSPKLFRFVQRMLR